MVILLSERSRWMYTYQDIIRILSPYASHVVVDKILLFEKNKSIHALKNITLTDIGFSNQDIRFVSTSLFLITESIFQLSILFAELSGILVEIDDFYMGGIDVKVFPGDTLFLELKLINSNEKHMNLQAQVLRDGQIVCSPRLTLKWGK